MSHYFTNYSSMKKHSFSFRILSSVSWNKNMWLKQSSVSSPAPDSGWARCDRCSMSDTKPTLQVWEMGFCHRKGLAHGQSLVHNIFLCPHWALSRARWYSECFRFLSLMLWIKALRVKMQLVALTWFVVDAGSQVLPSVTPCSSPEVRGDAKCNWGKNSAVQLCPWLPSQLAAIARE